MDYAVDKDYLLKTLERLIGCDSPVGYYTQMEPLMAELVGELGYHCFHDRKHTVYVRVPGKDRSRTVCLGAHLDTIALVVRGVNDDGTLRLRHLGGVAYASAEGSTCRVYTRDGRCLTGLVELDHHSPHAWTDSKKRVRDEESVVVHLLEDVSSPEDVLALGVTPGAVIALEPSFEVMDNGYVVSRFIDDKGCVACLLGMLKWLRDNEAVPACDVLLAFPFYEEVGWGGSYLPEDIDTYVALDITLIGPDYPGDEHGVSVVAHDWHGPYDWDVTNRLIACADSVIEGGATVQCCYHYSTDAMAAFLSANDVAAGAFGPATRNTHGRECTHVDALEKTQKLACAYVMGEA